VNTIHIYKADCTLASRVMMQSSWDIMPYFLHRKDFRKNNATNIKDEELGFLSASHLFFEMRQSNTAFVFHAQSSLPYLLMAIIIKFFFNGEKIKLIYDIHDIHALDSNSNQFLSRLRSNLRYYTFSLFESLVFLFPSVQKLTVSEGLASIYSKKKDQNSITVVRSIPSINSRVIHSDKERYDDTLIYFGTFERVPYELINVCVNQKINLHFKGRGIREKFDENSNEFPIYNQKCVDIMGDYEPNNLNFLLKYRYLVLYKPNSKCLNYKYSLPNKLFQAMYYGLSVIISPNFTEIIDLLGHIPGAIVIVDDKNKLRDLINKNNKLRTEEFFDLYQKTYYELQEKSKTSYLQIFK
jgi:hypothetical protein